VSEAPDLGRYDDAIAWLRTFAATDPDVRAVWIGGSAATGGYDEWSDLDIDMLCAPGTSARVHEDLLAGLPLPAASMWRLPDGTWPDGRQSFVTLDPDPGSLAAPTRILDLHVHDDTPAARAVDVRRHGRVIAVHDPDGLIAQRDDDVAELTSRRLAEVDQIRQRRDVAGWLVHRAIVRQQPAEATALYLRLGLGALVTLLRSDACPWRFDYGLRYLRADLPADQVDRVEGLLPGNAPLAELATRCFAWMDELLAEPPR
jgi:hypothetical protein